VQLAGRSGSKMLKAAAIAGGALASTSLAASGTAAPHSHRDAVVITIRPGHIAFCSLWEGQCTAEAWCCCAAHLDWLACALGRYPARWRSLPWPPPQ
jgi:hypothetical protein